ncbi:Nuclear speckle splicing regulatory protein 1 [Trichinella papuae]|uniref:Nuclear speckle splicing regulatory protein 1 n=1 Tax=Trichinella papuae TaxID=268474 RepID=A0A0V1MJN2_9BILA|nr:Nuclear speckle splicing regulatory protein 1 [Trichinella papuae]
MVDQPKKYGLILKKSAKAPLSASKLSVFDSSSDEEPKEASTSKAKTVAQSSLKLQHAVQIENALIEDPTAFQYDEVYEEMQEKRKNRKEDKEAKKDRKPKYVHSLLAAAHKRQMEFEAVEERKQQREREAEGDQFADKEVFVTGTYRRKLEELQKHNEELERKDRLDAMMDVSKQKDLSGFYRHLLADVTAESSNSTSADASSRNVNDKLVGFDKIESKTNSKKQYRRARDESSSSSESEVAKKDDQKNTGDGSDFEMDEEQIEEELKKSKLEANSRKQTRHRQFYTPSPPPQLHHHHHHHRSRREEEKHADRHRHRSPKERRHHRSHKYRSRDSSLDDEKRRTHSKKHDHDTVEKESVRSNRKSSDGENADILEQEADPVLGTVDPKIVKEKRLKKLKQIFAHRNDEQAIEEYRARYLLRKQIREAAAVDV